MTASRKFLLFLILGTSGVARASICDNEARPPTPAERSYLGLLTSSLRVGAVSDEDLAWLRQRKHPSNPVTAHSEIENIAAHIGFRKILRHLGDESWPYLLQGVERIIAKRKKDAEDVADAQRQTLNFFHWRKRDLQVEGLSPFPQFFSSKNEVFYPQVTQEGLVINELKSSSTAKAPGFFLDKHGDFYETSKGQVLFAGIWDNQLKVIDARSGSEEGNFSFSKVPEILAINRHSSNFSPILFEWKGNVKVALVPWGYGISRNEVAKQPITIVDVKSGLHRKRSVPHGMMGYQRGPDGHVYAYGFSENAKGIPRDVLVYDLTANSKVLNKKNVSGLMAGMIPSLYFDRAHKPQLVFNPWEANDTPHFFNQQANELEIIKSLGVVDPTGLMITSVNGEPWLFALSEDRASWSRFKLVYGPVSKWREHKSVPLTPLHSNDGGTFSGIHEVQSPVGRLIVFKEEAASQSLAAIHAFELNGKSLISVPLKAPIGRQSTASFVNSDEKTLLLFVLKSGATWEVMEYYGPP